MKKEIRCNYYDYSQSKANPAEKEGIIIVENEEELNYLNDWYEGNIRSGNDREFKLKNGNKISTQHMFSINENDIINDVTELSDKEIKEKVEEFMKEYCNLKYIKNATINNDYCKEYYNDNYITVIDIYIPDRVGQFITQKAIEYFGFKVNEEKYLNDDFSIYVDISNRIFGYASEWLNNKINTNGYYNFIINSDFKLEFMLNEKELRINDEKYKIEVIN